MGFRFRKSVKIIPGVRLNFSKSGVSTTLGGRGASLNIKHGRKTKMTVGVPGTGLSYSEHFGSNTPGKGPGYAGVKSILKWMAGVLIFIFAWIAFVVLIQA